jgi:hypothetical protein
MKVWMKDKRYKSQKIRANRRKTNLKKLEDEGIQVW